MKWTLAIFFLMQCFDSLDAMYGNVKEPVKNFLALTNQEKNIIDPDQKDISLELLLLKLDELYEASYEFIGNKMTQEFASMIKLGQRMYYIHCYTSLYAVLKDSFLWDIAKKDDCEFKKKYTSLKQFYPRLNTLYGHYIKVIGDAATPKGEYSIALQIKNSDVQLAELEEVVKQKIMVHVFS